MAVLLETNIGDLVIDLKVDHAPNACENFVKLCKIKYYNNCLFHTVQKDFIAQSGDPTNTGRGSNGTSVFGKLPGKAPRFFKDEISQALKHDKRGCLAMANEKPNENGSQFYITLRNKVEQLDGKHTIFGYVAEGMDVLAKMNAAMVDEKNAPYQNIRIRHTEILEDPFDDPEGLPIPPKSPDVIVDEELKTIEDEAQEAELQEKMAVTLAKSQATTLELLHDLPDADIAVPENDLFIAKLNPVTQDGDLELIFSRFGPIKSCEIVRDWKTGDSLQYAFVIFENVKDCEAAYLKMHDCVIDDRRIFVNFSQSVAKLWNKYRTGSRMSKDDAKDGAKGGGKGGGGKGKGKGKADGAPVLASNTSQDRPRDSKHGLVMDSSRDSRQRSPEKRQRSPEQRRAPERGRSDRDRRTEGSDRRSRSRDRDRDRSRSGGRDARRRR